MPSRDTDIRAAKLVDLPLVRRLLDKCVVLDSELVLTGDSSGSHSTLMSSLLLPQRGVHTLVARNDKQQVVGQFRLKPDDPHAQIVYLAPHLDVDADDTAWLYVLDAMAREAGKQGAHALIAELEESSPLFETMRTAGYAVYVRQEIWRREAGLPLSDSPQLELKESQDEDELAIFALFSNTVPSLVQQYAMPPTELPGFVYRVEGRVRAYIAYAEGKNGVYLIPYLDPMVLPDAAALFESAIRAIPRASRVPVYVAVRRYQDWASDALMDLEFGLFMQQAVMVKHISAGIRHAQFAPLYVQLEDATRPIRPPSNGYAPEVALEVLEVR
jgi:hypothetical protein